LYGALYIQFQAVFRSYQHASKEDMQATILLPPRETKDSDDAPPGGILLVYIHFTAEFAFLSEFGCFFCYGHLGGAYIATGRNILLTLATGSKVKLASFLFLLMRFTNAG